MNIQQCEGQVYGSQLGTDKTTNKACLFKIKNPESVDERRAKIGLQPMKEYMKYWKIDWNPANYPVCECEVNGR